MSTNLHREYPHLLFKRHWELTPTALMLLGQCEAYVKAIDNTPILPEHYAQLMRIALIKGAQATTAIEGNTLSEDEIRQIIDHQKLPPSKEYQEIEVRNILEAFNAILSEVIEDGASHLISEELLRRFHRMVGKDLGEYFNAIPGQLRNSDVIVGKYRCPDYRDVPILISKLTNWLKEEFKYGQREQAFSEIIIQAIVSHVYIEWIHPFGDGNGRTGRLVEFYILLRGGNPDISSHILSNYYNSTRPAYYHHLEKATEKKDLTFFIEYALLGFRDGLVQTLDIIQKSQFINTWKKLIYDKFDQIRPSMREEIFKRQRTLALEIPLDKPFSVSKVSTLTIELAKLYSSLNEKTIHRDINKLIELELVFKTSDNQYIANSQILTSMIAKTKKPILPI